jgi:uncharacterized protein YraI
MMTLLRKLAPLALSMMTAIACAPPSGEPESSAVEGSEETETSADALTGSVAVGATLQTTAGLNFRSGPSTSKSVKYVLPEGATVIVQQSSPQNGFYKVKHDGSVGWAHGNYLKVIDDGSSSDPGDEDPPSSSPRDLAITRAKSGVGFSYWWGHGRFRPEGPTSSNKGSCSGTCPSCSHSGSYGGDCSGFAAKVWQVPSSNTDLTDDEHPYSTADFHGSSSQWSTVSRSNLQKADALVYRSGGAGHIFVYEKGDGWGSMYAYECKGCSAGCIQGYRTASSSYKGIRRAGW